MAVSYTHLYFAGTQLPKVGTDHPAFGDAERQVREQIIRLQAVNGNRSPDSFHRELGTLMWDNCGMGRNRAGLEKALKRIPELREEFWKNVRVVGAAEEFNQQLEKAGRVADFLEFGELMCLDADVYKRQLRKVPKTLRLVFTTPKSW